MRFAAPLLLLASLPAQAQTQAQVDRLVAAVEAAGCVITEANNQAILRQSGLTEAEGRTVIMSLFSKGKALPKGDDVKIISGKCK